MRPNVLLMRTLCCAFLASLALMLTLGAQTAAPAKARAGSNAMGKAAPEKAPEPKIEGIAIPRGDGGFLGVALAGTNFKITFYDKQKKPVAADVHRALLRWDPKYKVGQERTVLNLTADGRALTSPKPVRPPHNFRLFITLLQKAEDGEDKAGETFSIQFRA